jgi:carboxylesterase type B
MKNASLFIGAIMESATQIVYYRTLEQAQTGYDCLAKATGCNATTSSLACLRSVNSTALQTSSCTFNPTIDADLIPITPFHAFAQGDYLAIPTIFGTTADEGTDFAPTYISTPAQFNQFLQAYVPSLSNSSFAVLDKLYITNDTEPVFPGAGALYRNAANVLGDIGFHCTAKIYQDAIVSDGGKTWSYRYAVRDPEDEASGSGAYHTVELNAVWGPNNTDGNPPKSYLPGGINAEIVDEVRPYWINFVKALDPNAGPGGQVEWETWGNGRRIRFVTNETAMEDLDSGERYRCKVIDPLVRVLEQEPPAGTVTELTL